MSLLSGMETIKGNVEATLSDEIRTGNKITVFDSNIYKMKIKLAYLGKSTKGAMYVKFNFEEIGTGSKFNETIYITSGNAKGNKPYYINKETKKQAYLPGYVTVNTICSLLLKKGILKLKPEDKMLKIYDQNLGKEAPTKTEVLTELTGKTLILGLFKKKENKRAKGPTGDYVPTEEIREFNEIDKVFDIKTGKTVREINDSMEAILIHKWKESAKDKVIDKTTKVTPTVKLGGGDIFATKEAVSVAAVVSEALSSEGESNGNSNTNSSPSISDTVDVESKQESTTMNIFD